MQDEEKQSQLDAILRQLARTEAIVDDRESIVVIQANLMNIYEDAWRHQYACILPLLLELYDENPDNLTQLIYNLNGLFTCSCDCILHEKLFKLRDHVFLEIARIQYWKDQTQGADAKFQGISSDLDRMRKLAQRLNKQVTGLADTVTSIQTQFVSILGIFASIVLVLSGSISFANSVFSNITKATMPQVGVALCLFAFVIINTIYCLTGVLLKSLRIEMHIPDSKYITIVNGILGALLVGFLFCPPCWYH